MKRNIRISFTPFKLSIYTGLLLLPVSLYQGAAAQTSFLDTDFFCQNFGCVVVHDGQTFEVYDNFQFSTNRCCIPFGAQMISFFNRANATNLTGTTQRSDNFRPDQNQGFRLGVIQDSSGTPSLSTFDDGDGFLDAADSLSAFAITDVTDIGLEADGRSYSHSFFISSRNTRFSVRAQAEIADARGDFADTVGLDDIELDVSITRTGNDDGFAFGNNTRNGASNISTNVSTLADLDNTQTELARFTNANGIRLNNGSLNSQVIRFDLEYTMPQYDFSMGLGSLDVDLMIDFFREP